MPQHIFCATTLPNLFLCTFSALLRFILVFLFKAVMYFFFFFQLYYLSTIHLNHILLIGIYVHLHVCINTYRYHSPPEMSLKNFLKYSTAKKIFTFPCRMIFLTKKFDILGSHVNLHEYIGTIPNLLEFQNSLISVKT